MDAIELAQELASIDLRNMKHTVTAHVLGQIELHCHRTNHSNDRERTHPLRHEFLTLSLREVLGTQQHKLIWMVCNL